MSRQLTVLMFCLSADGGGPSLHDVATGDKLYQQFVLTESPGDASCAVNNGQFLTVTPSSTTKLKHAPPGQMEDFIAPNSVPGDEYRTSMYDTVQK